MTLNFPQRLRLLSLLGLAACGFLFLRLFWLQVVEHGHWSEQAEAQRAGWRPVTAPRGVILDRRGRVLARDEAGFDLVLRAAAWEGRLWICTHCSHRRYYKQGEEGGRCPNCRDEKRGVMRYADFRDLKPAARLLDMAEADLLALVERRVDQAYREMIGDLLEMSEERRERVKEDEWQDHGWRDRRLVRDVSYEVAREVELHPERNPAFRIRTVHTRRNEGGREFVHILGRVREHTLEIASPEGQKHFTDVTQGASGLEGGLDPVLRGVPGWVRLHRAPRRRSRAVLDERPPIPGLDVRLTLTVEDQRLGIDALAGAQGALAVVNADTGAVLVLVSEPGYLPENYASELAEIRRVKEILGRWPNHHAMHDAAASGYYAPGSIFKPFTALAALDSGIPLETHAHCDGSFYNRKGQRLDALKCSGVHGDVDLAQATRVSCNIYFQNLMARLVEERRFDHFVQVAHRFGVGVPTGLETEAFRETLTFEEENWWYGVVASSIGQGALECSPAQMARAYAALATGRLPRLHLVAQVGSRPTAVERTPVGVSEPLLARLRDALREVPRTGTAAGFGLEQWDVACKTGTAQKGRGANRTHNAWMAGFAPPRHGRPRIAFAMVVLDTPLHGGEVCAPRLREFFRQFYSAEGDGQ